MSSLVHPREAIRALTRRLRSEERGVVFVMVAILLPVFIGLAALAIDLGSLNGAQRQAQAAADSAALAGAAALPSTTAASATATTLAKTNYPTATPTVTATATQVTVKVDANPPNFFGKAFPVSASAVAASGTTGVPGAIFVSDTSCSGGISLQNSNMTITGGIRSSGSMQVSSHGSVYSSATYACALQDGTNGDNRFNGATAPPSEPKMDTTFDSTWPDSYTDDFPVYPLTAAGDPNCTASLIRSDWNFQTSNITLATGVYCANTIEFNASGLTCTCTFVAGSFQMNQGPDNFAPLYNGKLSFYDVNDTSLNINSNGPNFFNHGVLFAPNAVVNINSPSGQIYGFVEAKDVSVNSGGASTWTGTGATVNGVNTGVALTQ